METVEPLPHHRHFPLFRFVTLTLEPSSLLSFGCDHVYVLILL
jgi:hypothetical protein